MTKDTSVRRIQMTSHYFSRKFFMLILAMTLSGAFSEQSYAITSLTSGVPDTFLLPGVDEFTVFTGRHFIIVPEGVSRLDIKLTSTTPGLSLFSRWANDIFVSGGRVFYDQISS